MFKPAGPTNAGLAAMPAMLASPAPAAPVRTPSAPVRTPAAPVRVRAQNEDAPPRLVMPSPESLGIAPARAAASPAVDWNLTHQRLKALGAVGFHLDRVGSGTRVTFWLPTADPERTLLIEATASSEAEAVSLALAQADTIRR